MILSLKGQVKEIKKEINPTVQLTGSRFGTTAKQPLHRHLNIPILPKTGDTLNVQTITGSVLGLAGMPDGSRILDFKVTNRTGRRVAVNIPVASNLCFFGINGNPSVVQKEVWAPLSRFPSLKVNIPDVVASTIDTNDTTNVLFTINGLAGVPNDFFTINIHYIDYV
jgi:hypothetical protein